MKLLLENLWDIEHKKTILGKAVKCTSNHNYINSTNALYATRCGGSVGISLKELGGQMSKCLEFCTGKLIEI